MTEHILKTVEPYFTAVKTGEKTFEARRNDRGYQKGDTLVLLDPSNTHSTCDDTCHQKLRGSIMREVTFVFSGDPGLRDLGGVVPGYVVLGLGDIESSSVEAAGYSRAHDEREASRG